MTFSSEKNGLLSNNANNSISFRKLTKIFCAVSFFGSSILFMKRPLHRDEEATIVIKEIVSFPGEQDEILNLPELPTDYTGRHYSGYLPVGKSGMLHYWFVESLQDPLNDPVVLWLNGGPGASSLSGLLYEHGPYLMNDDGTLRRNIYSWNNKANMIYFEAPVGVGFSYDKSGEYMNGDYVQAKDNLDGLLGFFGKFPHLKKNKFIVTGESYGGVYVPTLAKEIVEWNQLNPQKMINLEAFAVGNGVNEYHANSQLYFGYYHGLFGMNRWKSIRRNCPSLREFHLSEEDYFAVTENIKDNCSQARTEALGYITTSHINSYDIYGKCAHGDPNYGIDKLVKSLSQDQMHSHQHPISQPLGLTISMCLNNSAALVYLNRKDVKKAIHVPEYLEWTDVAMTNITFSSLKALNLTSPKPILHYGMPLKTHVVDTWKFLLENNVRGVIYHGDVDVMCDFIGGQWAVESLNLPVVQGYSPWHLKNEFGIFQAGGFVKQFEGMSFVTIKGAGHMAPQWKPQESMHMFQKYILQIDELDF